MSVPDNPAAGRPLCDLLAAARAAFAAASVNTVPTAELGDALGEIAALRNQLDALDVQITHKAKATAQWAADGSPSSAEDESAFGGAVPAGDYVLGAFEAE